MTEPSVPFVFPDENAAEVEAAREEGQRAGFRLACTMFTAKLKPHQLLTDFAALQHLAYPERETVSGMARRLGVSRKTIHARINNLRRILPFLGNRRLT